MIEQWADVPGYEGLYKVSTLGRVCSMNWRKQGIVRLLALKPTNKGYRQVELFRSGKGKMVTVHRLVATTFLPNPNNYKTINHINEDKTDNSVVNLEWCDLSENVMKYRMNHLDELATRKSKNAQRKIVQLSIDGDLIREWENVATVHQELNYNNWSISQCCDGKRRTAYGFRWQYAV